MKIFKRNKWPDVPFEEIRERAKLVTIDDQDFYYLDLFRKDGYHMDKWDDIQDLQKLESGYYDIILLDLQGVGKEQSSDQGFGILKHLRKRCPTQIIVAYSNADWSIKYQDFFQMADAVLHKQKDYVDFKRTVDTLLAERFSIGFYLDRVAKIAAPYVINTDKIRTLATKAILSKSLSKLQPYVEKHIDDKETINLILNIVQIAINVASLAAAL